MPTDKNEQLDNVEETVCQQPILEADAEQTPVADPSSCKRALSSKPKARKGLWAMAALLCVVALAAGTYLTYTAYMAGDFLKSVAVSGTSQSLFASDLLTGYTSENLDDNAIAGRSVVVDTSGEGDSCSFTFRVYNYLLGDMNKVNDKEVNATLTITASGVDDGEWNVSRSVSPAVATGGEALSFPANQATLYTYTVFLPKAKLNQASFTIKAKVGADSPGTNLTWLAAKITPAERAEVTASGVSGEWVDGNSDIGDFDAYNYRVTVTGTQAQIVLTWKDGVEIDPFFAANHSGKVDGNSVTFTMDPGLQIITFYRTSDTAPTSWDDIGVSIESVSQGGGV